jgi:hypothetical protein
MINHTSPLLDSFRCRVEAAAVARGQAAGVTDRDHRYSVAMELFKVADLKPIARQLHWTPSYLASASKAMLVSGLLMDAYDFYNDGSMPACVNESRSAPPAVFG